MVDKAVALILRGQRYVAPDKYLNLPLAFDRARRHYNKARVDGVPEKRLSVLRQYIGEIEALLKQGKEEMAAEQAAAQAQAAPPAQGAPTPEEPQ